MMRLPALLALVGAATALLGCGATQPGTPAGSVSGTAAGRSILRLEAEPGGQPAYTTSEASVNAGTVTLELVNASPVPHDLRIEDSTGAVIGKTDVIAGSTTTGDTIRLKAGRYVFYCSVPGHREAGMEGALTVE